MAVNSYDIGDLVRVSVAFTNSGGTAVDPSSVVLKYVAPGGTAITRTYGEVGEVQKDSTGAYHYDIDTTDGRRGEWWYKWYGTGTAQAMVKGRFVVETDQFDG